MRSRRACRVLLSSVLLTAWSQVGIAQIPVVAKPIRVQVKVSADPELKGVVQKSLEDELRALPGVQVTEASPEFIISVITLKVVTRSQKDVGSAFSVLVTEPFVERIERFAESHVAPEFREQLITTLAGAVKPRAHWVETASAADVPKVCRSIALSFDAEVLTERRKASVLAPR
ncbi:MAG TPA: hypothetical protein VJ813_06595 [Vicinamibacterales bacterium]|nr:hypothetical protein [Vicinamibacterales bacterium]